MPLHGDRALFEKLSLEGFQAGLSWITILRKRPRFREVFAGFDPAAVAAFGEDDIARLMADAGIIRNRAKIEATISNARLVVDMEDGELDACCGRSHRRPGAAAGILRRHPRRDPGVRGDEQGAAQARLPLRRADDDVRADAVRGHGRRPRERMLAHERLCKEFLTHRLDRRTLNMSKFLDIGGSSHARSRLPSVRRSFRGRGRGDRHTRSRRRARCSSGSRHPS